MAEDALPADNLVRHYKAALTDTAVRPDTEEEIAYRRASDTLPPRRALSAAAIGAVLIITGFVLQAVGVVVS